MKSLTKRQLEQRQKLVEKLYAAKTQIEAEIATFNAKLDELKSPVVTAVGGYNSLLGELEEFASEVHGAIQDFLEERSDRWLESERGQETIEWGTIWESPVFDELIAGDFLPEPIDEQSMEALETFEGLDTEI